MLFGGFWNKILKNVKKLVHQFCWILVQNSKKCKGVKASFLVDFGATFKKMYRVCP